MNRIIINLILIVGILLGACTVKDGTTGFHKLLVEYTESPIDLDLSHPRFSWIVESTQRGQGQSAYQILVSTNKEQLKENKADLWDTGKIDSDMSIQHMYAGKSLSSNSTYYWKVIVWDVNNEPIESEVNQFETAILDEAVWSADWIGNGPVEEILPEKGFFGHKKEEADMPEEVNHNGRSLLLRNEVNLDKKIVKAKAFISGLGFYEFYINGQRVGDRVLAPAKSPYHKHILYDTYDVTELFVQGDNALGIHLGNGWYNPYKLWWKQYRMQWFGHKKAMLQVHFNYSDGSKEVITTNKDWKWADGPIIYNCVYDGEVYDANFYLKDWNTTNFEDGDWNPVNVVNSPEARLVSHRMPAIKVNEIIEPTEVKVDVENMRVFDMRQNFTGWVKLKVKGEKGTRLTLRFAEDINADGTIDRTSAERAKAQAEYIMSGDGVEVYEPAFTYFGFKYMDVVSDKPIDIEHVEGRVVYSANEKAGEFVCDNELVNKIHHATVWSQKSNMLGYPMDCPQRDERLGWFGDAQVTAEEAMFNFNMALHYDNWFEGIKDNQDELTGDIPIISPQPYFIDEGVEWSSTYIIMLWQYYIYYGDDRILKRHYPTMVRYMQFLDSIAENRIVPMGWIGDWGSMTEGWTEGNPRSIPTAFYHYNSRILAKVAEVIGEKRDVKYYTELAEDIKKAYNKEYFNTETGNYLTGTQMDNAFPLFLDLVDDAYMSKVLDNLVTDIVDTNEKHLTTGVLGTKYMPEALAKYGRYDVAWDIINQKTYPSWNDMMSKYTTTCEFWTLKQSKNHVMMGSIDAWFYKYITGIQLDETAPAYKHFFIKPVLLDGLNFGKADLETIKGRIVCDWKKEGGKLQLKVEVPFNTEASVSIPGSENTEVHENGKTLTKAEGITYLGYSDGAHQVRVASGEYNFITDLTN